VQKALISIDLETHGKGGGGPSRVCHVLSKIRFFKENEKPVVLDAPSVFPLSKNQQNLFENEI